MIKKVIYVFLSIVIASMLFGCEVRKSSESTLSDASDQPSNTVSDNDSESSVVSQENITKQSGLTIDMVKTIILDSDTKSDIENMTRSRYIVDTLRNYPYVIVENPDADTESEPEYFWRYNLTSGGYVLIPHDQYEYTVVTYCCENSDGSILSKEELFSPTDINSPGLTKEMVKSIIDEAETASKKNGITKGRYIWNQLIKYKRPVYRGSGSTIIFFYLDHTDKDVEEYIAIPGDFADVLRIDYVWKNTKTDEHKDEILLAPEGVKAEGS